MGNCNQSQSPWSTTEIRTLSRLWAEGLSLETISGRLGRSPGSVRGAAQRHQLGRRGGPEARNCLWCSGLFQPEHRHNRVCPRCKLRPEWSSGQDHCEI